MLSLIALNYEIAWIAVNDMPNKMDATRNVNEVGDER